MFTMLTGEIVKQRERQAAARAERMAPHLQALRRVCRPAWGLFGKLGMCRPAAV